MHSSQETFYQNSEDNIKKYNKIKASKIGEDMIRERLESYLCPNCRVDFVSASLYDAGEQQITMVVLALPPSDSCKIRVSLLSR